MRCFNVALAAIGAIMLLGGIGRQPPAEGPLPPPPGETPLTLLRMRLVRQRTSPTAPRDAVTSTTELPLQGLFVDAVLEGSPKSRIASVVVESATATDSVGTDLVGPIVRGQPDPVTQLQDCVGILGSAAAVRWSLATPDKAASSIDARLLVTLVVADSYERVELEPRTEWTRVESPALPGLKAEYRFWALGDLEFIAFRPVQIADLIARVDPRMTPRGLRTGWSTRDRNEVSYMTNRQNFPNEKPSVTFYAKTRTVKALLVLDDEPLP